MKITAMFHSNVLLRPDPEREEIRNGIVIPEFAKRGIRPPTGTVVLLGPGSEEHPMPSLKPGDRVMYNSATSVEVRVEGETFVMIEAGALGAKIED
jgi:co-chaperonin GroES (HSP10)